MAGGLYLGLDVGTTASKAVLVDADGRVVARGRATHPAASRTGRVDPSTWWSSAVQAVVQLGNARSETIAVGVSVHSPVLVPLDEDGAAVSDGYRFDTPGLAGIVSAAAAAIPAELHARIGNAFTPATAIVAAHRMLQRDDPEAAARVRWLGSVGSVLGHRLTGRLAIDPSQASYSGCFDVVGGSEWLADVAEELGVAPEVLPPVLASGSALGPLLPDVAEVLGLPRDTPVAVAGGDTPSAAAAVGLGRESDTLLSLGTTHVVTRWREEPDPGNRRLLQRVHLDPGTWLAHGATNGGLALAEGAALVSGVRDSAVADTIAAAASLGLDEIAEAPFFLPHVTAERGPLWMSQPATGFIGHAAKRASDPRLASWAVVEGVVFADRLVLEHMAAGDAEPLNVAADLSTGGEFVQIAADAFGRELVVIEEPHLSAVGSARHAARASGVQMPPVSAEVRFSPRQDHAALLESRWHAWRQARNAYLDR